MAHYKKSQATSYDMWLEPCISLVFAVCSYFLNGTGVNVLVSVKYGVDEVDNVTHEL